MDAQGVLPGTLSKQAEIVTAIIVIQKDGAPIDAPLSYVERNAGDFQAGLAGHR